MTGSVSPDRMAELLAAALRLGMRQLPAVLRERGGSGLEILTIEALLRVNQGQPGSPFAGSGAMEDGRPMTPLAHSFDEAADLLSVSVSTVKRLVASGQLRSVSVGPQAKRIPHSVLVDFVADQLAA